MGSIIILIVLNGLTLYSYTDTFETSEKVGYYTSHTQLKVLNIVVFNRTVDKLNK